MKEILLIIIITGLAGCNQSPTELKPDKTPSETEAILSNSSVFGNTKRDTIRRNTDDEVSEVHKVKVLEILPTVKYLYLRVVELGDEYWIATLKADVIEGEYYYITGGLLKTNFESKEHNRIFDKMLLIENIVPENHSQQTTDILESDAIVNNNRSESSIKLSEIINNPQKYVGQRVQIEGTCIKVNENIMGLNWIHINDGTNANTDFIATTTETIPLGTYIILKGVVAVDKDLGSGYFYPILLEGCEQIK